MFECWDSVLYEVFGHKTERMKAKHHERSKQRQIIREQRKKATPEALEAEKAKREAETKQRRETQKKHQSTNQHKPRNHH